MRLLIAMLAVSVLAVPGCRFFQKSQPKTPTRPPKIVRPTSAPAPASMPERMANWPAFRGPDPCSPVPNGGDPLIQIDPARDLRFKTVVPDDGQSSPIVWGNRIFLTGSRASLRLNYDLWSIDAGVDHADHVLAFDRETGQLLWDKVLEAQAEIPMPGDEKFKEKIGDTGMAAPTAVTDGRHVYAFFGNSVLGCVDFDGKQVWAQRLVPGKPRSIYGLAASPVLYGDLLIQVVDLGSSPEENLSFVVAVRTSDGVEAWRQDRPVKAGWTTPLLAHLPEGDTLITTSTPWVIAYDPKLGTELWRAGKLPDDVAVCPIVCGGLVIVPSSDSGDLLAFKPGGKGDVTKSHLAWSARVPMPNVASPVCDGKRYFHVTASADLYCLDPATGDELWKYEMKGQFWSSPVLVRDRIYAINAEGVVYVVSTDGKELAIGRILSEADSHDGERITATPAIVDGRIYVRTSKHLLCIGAK